MEQYKLPLRKAEAGFVEKKSRFISHISPVSSEDEARAFLGSIRVKHREANHNVYAYRIRENNICRFSDDGEPSGTAGMPLLEPFLKQDIHDFCCVATRYFGGTLLGAGGLVRAYARCGAVALEASGIGIMRELVLCAATMPYSQFEAVKRCLIACGADMESEDFGADVALKFSLLPEGLPELQRSIAELTAGSVRIVAEGKRFAVCGPQIRSSEFGIRN